MKTKRDAALTMILAGILINPMFQNVRAADAENNWALKQLHSPSPSLRKMESAGRVTIFDGVTVADVDDAMDRQFDRIQSMMFIRTKYPVENGTFEADSDCD